MKQCAVAGCARPLYARDWCKSHYARWERHGDVQAHVPIRTTPPFWERIDAEGDCWEWTGPRNRDGYGHTSRTEGSALAHRRAYEALVGPIPDGLTLDHLCRNRVCVNPAHLQPVTRAENVMRGVGHGARNARKTHCPKGHPYAGENLVIGKGGRACRACKNERQRVAA